MPRIRVIIPVFNEAASIESVLAEIPKSIVTEVVVVDNGSTDETGVKARKLGATVLREDRKGYGSACLKGIDYLEHVPTDIVVFMDGDYSDYPEEIKELVHPILHGTHDMVIGSRTLGKREKGSLTTQQIFGNWLATRLIRLLYGAKFTDLGPFRAIRYSSLKKLEMTDTNYGWTIEMQIKFAKRKWTFVEVPVRYRKRIGSSKISGTIKGSVLAGIKIIYTIAKHL